MGGRAHSLTIGLGAPADLPARWALDFAAGFAAECDLVGASVVGGDLTRCDQVVIAVTVIGACTQSPGAPLGRRSPATCWRWPGARAGPPAGWRSSTRGLPLAAGAGRGLPAPQPAVRRRPGRRRGRRHVDDRRLRRAAGRRRPPGRRLRASRIDVRTDVAGGPRAAARGRRGHRRRPGLVRARRRRGPLAAGHVPGTARSPTAGPSSASVAEGEGVTVDGAAYDGETGWTHF